MQPICPIDPHPNERARQNVYEVAHILNQTVHTHTHHILFKPPTAPRAGNEMSTTWNVLTHHTKW